MKNIISNKFKNIISIEYRNNYTYTLSIGNLDNIRKYFFCNNSIIIEDEIINELQTEKDSLAILFLNLIKFKIGKKEERYKNSKICLELLKKQKDIFYEIVFEIYVYKKLLDILKEIKNVRKDEVNFLDNFIFSLYKNIEKKTDLSNCIPNFLFYLGKENSHTNDIIYNETNKINDLSNIGVYKVILDNSKFIEEKVYQKIIIEYIEKLINFIEKDTVEASTRDIFLLNKGMQYINKITVPTKKEEFTEKVKRINRVLIKNVKEIQLKCIKKEIEIDNNIIEEPAKNLVIDISKNNLEENVNFLEKILENELKNISNNSYDTNQGLIKFASYLKIGDFRVIANKKDNISDFYTHLTDYIFLILEKFSHISAFNVSETKKLVYILKNEEMKGFSDEIIENYFCRNYFTCCSAISPTIEKIIRNTYFKLGKSNPKLNLVFLFNFSFSLLISIFFSFLIILPNKAITLAG